MRALVAGLTPALLGAGCVFVEEESVDGHANETADGTTPDAAPIGPAEDTAWPGPTDDAPYEEALADPTPAATTPPPPATPPAAAPPAASPPPAAPAPPSATPAQPTPPSPAPRGDAWPREGSHVAYALGGYRIAHDGSFQREFRGEARWTYAEGDWRGTCTLRTSEHIAGRWENRTQTRAYSASSPPHWPLLDTRSPPAEGGAVKAWYLEGCDIASFDAVFAGAQTEPTSREGRPVNVATYVARDPEGAQSEDFRSEWSQRAGVVVTWDLGRYGGTFVTRWTGGLADTDAPL